MRKLFAIILMVGSLGFTGCGQEIRLGSGKLSKSEEHELFKALTSGAHAKFTLKVVDADGVIVPDANIVGNFALSESDKGFRGTTDSNGTFSMSGKSKGELLYGVSKEGYYHTSVTTKFQPEKGLILKDGKWQPWNPTITVVLKKIKNPVPMYAKKVETQIPTVNCSFGFDLVIGDWVAPVGKGVVEDFIFSTSGFWKTYRDNDSTLTITFKNPTDGLICFPVVRPVGTGAYGSDYRLVYEAPQIGYMNVRRLKQYRKSTVGSNQDEIYTDCSADMNYFFRIRSATNEAGVITNSYHGKIHADFEYGGAGTNGCWLKFTYYLNPTPNDRNLEFDPKRNLLKGLSSLEEVTAP